MAGKSFPLKAHGQPYVFLARSLACMSLPSQRPDWLQVFIDSTYWLFKSLRATKLVMFSSVSHRALADFHYMIKITALSPSPHPLIEIKMSFNQESNTVSTEDCQSSLIAYNILVCIAMNARASNDLPKF